MCFKILSGSVNLSFSDFFKNSVSRGHCKRLYVEGIRVDCRKFVFCNRAVSVWNNLPEETGISRSISEFCTNLGQYGLSRFCTKFGF